MNLLARSLYLLCTVPAMAGASSGTLHFRGALVEPTCQAELLTAPQAAGAVTVRLFDCRVSPQKPGAASGGVAQTGASRHVSGPLQLQQLSSVVAELAGRAQIGTLTFTYE